MVQGSDEAATVTDGMSGHHSGEGRNVIDARGLGGQDIFSAVVRMTRMPMCLADPNQPDLPLVFVNEAFQHMTGYPEAGILSRNCRSLQGPDTDPGAVRRVREALAVELLNYKRDGARSRARSTSARYSAPTVA